MHSSGTDRTHPVWVRFQKDQVIFVTNTAIQNKPKTKELCVGYLHILNLQLTKELDEHK